MRNKLYKMNNILKKNKREIKTIPKLKYFIHLHGLENLSKIAKFIRGLVRKIK